MHLSWNKGCEPTQHWGISKTKTGYRVRVRAVDSRTGKLREANREFVGITLAEALRRQVEMKETLTANVAVAARARVGEFARSWIASKAGVVSEDTLEGYGFALEHHILPALGDFFYDAVGHLEVQEMIATWKGKRKRDGKPYSHESMKDWLGIFANMTRDAMVQLGIGQDPTVRVSLGEPPKREQEATATTHECLAVLTALRRIAPGTYALLHTSACTGQRLCHVTALQWGDIDFDNAVIAFRRKQVRKKVGPISRKKSAPRMLHLLGELAVTLEAHRARMGKLGYKVGPGDWVFPSRTGTLKEPSSLTNALRSAKRAAGVTARVTPHDMRYLNSDVLRMAGVDQVTRKAMVGHVTDQMQEHYSSVEFAEKRAAALLVEAKLRELRSGDRSGDRVKN